VIGAAVLLFQAASPIAAQQPPDDVVVIGRPLRSYREDLEACIARGCSPKEEIDKSIFYAEAQLLVGEYEASRSTLLKARRRNARFAKDFPVDVADLHYATSRLSDLNGFRDSARIGRFDVVDALKAGLPKDHWRVMAARLEVGDFFAAQGRPLAALSHFHWVERKAALDGARLVVGMAKFRRAALLAVLASVERGWAPRAKQAAAEILGSPDPDWAPLRNGVRTLPVFLSPAKLRAAVADQVMAALEPDSSPVPQLLYAPAIDTTTVSFGAARGDKPQWADVAFSIDGGGRVAEVTVLRKSDGFADPWLEVGLRALRARRYVPPKLAPGSFGIPRIERYSLVSDFAFNAETQSRIRVRSSTRRIDVLDISEPAKPGV
jgi:hypothetical protein